MQHLYTRLSLSPQHVNAANLGSPSSIPSIVLLVLCGNDGRDKVIHQSHPS